MKIDVLRKVVVLSSVVSLAVAMSAFARQPIDDFRGRPPFHIHKNATVPVGLSPAVIKAIYNLPSTGGNGTIAIVDAYDDPNIESDLGVFSSQFGLPPCSTANGCFEKHKTASRLTTNSGWGLEISLDVEWAHAIAPNAKILLVEAKSNRGSDLLSAVDYARGRADVVAVSMSWGGGEFSGEAASDFHFTSDHGVVFLASSGDSGAGVEWPAVSANVIGVGGTTLNFDSNGQLSSETAWSGSGGGVSAFETEPAYQTTYGVPGANGKRAVPDVSYDADPVSGVAVYDSFAFQGQTGWFQVGGTSAGAPQWAAIRAIGGTASNANFYADAANAVSYGTHFRDITSGTNGTCGFYCSAAAAYDYVTGLGSPVTISF